MEVAIFTNEAYCPDFCPTLHQFDEKISKSYHIVEIRLGKANFGKKTWFPAKSDFEIQPIKLLSVKKCFGSQSEDCVLLAPALTLRQNF